MLCRHTVPDWHRYVAGGEASQPIFAACRLLLKEGERASEPRTIACAYWGRQRECPLYDGPASRSDARPAAGASGNADVPVGREGAWPVRSPGAVDGQRVLLLALGGLSVVLLTSAVLLGLAVLFGARIRTGYLVVMLGGCALSVGTHVLALLRLWIRG